MNLKDSYKFLLNISEQINVYLKLNWEAALTGGLRGGEEMPATKIYLENGLLFLLLPRMVVPAGPSLALSRNQLAGGSFKSVFSSRRANAVRGGAEEYFTTARLFTSLPPRNKADP